MAVGDPPHLCWGAGPGVELPPLPWHSVAGPRFHAIACAPCQPPPKGFESSLCVPWQAEIAILWPVFSSKVWVHCHW